MIAARVAALSMKLKGQVAAWPPPPPGAYGELTPEGVHNAGQHLQWILLRLPLRDPRALRISQALDALESLRAQLDRNVTPI